jgi:hypothetical protein
MNSFVVLNCAYDGTNYYAGVYYWVEWTLRSRSRTPLERTLDIYSNLSASIGRIEAAFREGKIEKVRFRLTAATRPILRS